MEINQIKQYKNHLINEEKSVATIEKYLRDITAFYTWLGENELTKEIVLTYKQELIKDYATASVNAAICSLNGFFAYIGRHDLKMKSLKVQRKIFCQVDKELTKAEYERLLKAAKDKNNDRLYYIMQTICATGIRISELRFVDVSAVKTGKAEINCKGKMRTVFLSKQLCKMLESYINRHNITDGSVFVTKSGKPVDRSNVWSDMRRLCESANVEKSKVFPHNLRHLFARTYYSLEKDLSRLADILGHSNIETTRIYTMETGIVHRKQLEKLGLLLL